MKTRNIRRTLMTAMFVAVMSLCNAQIFITGDEDLTESQSPRAKGDPDQEWLIVPVQGETIDQYAYTPVGGGVLLLAGMAGAYAFAKRRKEK